MGMYTSLRCKCIVKDEFRPLIKQLMECGEWVEVAHEYEFLEKYVQDRRADFIPFGAVAYMPDSWEQVPVTKDGKLDWMNAKATDNFELQFDEKTGYWAF